MAPWADVLYACDDTWWSVYFPEVSRGFAGGELWTISAKARDMFGIRWIHGAPKGGVSSDPTAIHTGLNSGFQALGLAHLFGAARILLLGYDFQVSGGRVHWHGDHPRGLGNGGRYQDWIREMNNLAVDLNRLGIPVTNCSRLTALKCFARSTIQECL